jgi:hypothetical protein
MRAHGGLAKLCSTAALSRAQGAVALAGPPVVRLCGVEALLGRC